MTHSVKDVEIYHKDGTFFEKVSIYSLLKDAMEHILGRSLDKNESILVYLNAIAAPRTELSGTPSITNLTPEYGYASVTLKENYLITYQHPHSVEELIAQTLQRRLGERYPQETAWKFKISIPPVQHDDYYYDAYPAPLVRGAMPILPYAENEAMPFTITKAQEPPLPRKSLEDFSYFLGAHGESTAQKVLVHEKVVDELLKQRRFSSRVEEGGFLLGKAYQEDNQDNSYLLEITQALSAEYTGASLLHFTYTGDSFAAMKRILREKYPQDRLLGWYHTHLFPASVPMGLSSIDWELHFTTFRIPWQIAGLVNLDGANQRTLRFFARQDKLMLTCPWWVLTH